MPQPPRRFSTAARLHPGIMPHLSRPRAMPIKTLTAVTAIAVAAYGAKTFVDKTLEANEQRRRESYLEQQARHEQLNEFYGDRSSLEELEKAIASYEKK